MVRVWSRGRDFLGLGKGVVGGNWWGEVMVEEKLSVEVSKIP